MSTQVTSSALHQDLNIRFFVEGTLVRVLTFASERPVKKVPRHSHGPGCYELHYILSGKGRVFINGKFYDMSPNRFYIAGPCSEHMEISSSEDLMHEYCVYYKIDTASLPRTPLLSAFLSIRAWAEQDHSQILPLLTAASREIRERLPGYEEQMSAILKQLFISLTRLYQQGNPTNRVSAKNVPPDRRSVIAEDYFLYEYKNAYLEELSKRLGLSPRQTERFLKGFYGKTFLQKRTEARMSNASMLLADSCLSITAVSEELGYSSVEHFSNAFRQYYGISPRNFRKKHLQFSESLV